MTAPAQQGDDGQRLIRQIGRALLAAAPPEWKQLRAEYRSVGRHIEADVFVTAPDGTTRPVRPPMDVVELLGQLRAAMYRPGRGTWLSGVYLLDHPSKFSAEFEPDTEPRWRRVPPPIGFQDELRRFPRQDEHIPAWFRARAGLPPVADPTPTPPRGVPVPAGPAAGGPGGHGGPGASGGAPSAPGGGHPGPGPVPAPVAAPPGTPPGGVPRSGNAPVPPPGRVPPAGAAPVPPPPAAGRPSYPEGPQ